MENIAKYAVIAVVVGGLVVGAWKVIGPSNGRIGAVSVPELSAMAVAGQKAFEANCAGCHGLSAAGTDKGPPLVHTIYNPGHHSDEAFFFAAKQGVRQHHWPYGNMPPQPQVKDREIEEIVAYVRELQQANGIFYRPHQM